MSGRNNVLSPVTVISGGDMSGNLVSGAQGILFLDNIGIQFVWTGTPTGSLDVDISQDGSSWTTLTLSPTLGAAGSASNAYADLNQMSAAYVRARYTAVSGSGALTVKVSGKAV